VAIDECSIAQMVNRLPVTAKPANLAAIESPLLNARRSKKAH